MKIVYGKQAVIKLPNNPKAFAVQTPDQFAVASIMQAHGKRGSGKSVAITNLLRICKEHFKDDMRIILVSPTEGSNFNVPSELGGKNGDVFGEPDDNVPEKSEKHCMWWERFLLEMGTS
jgi:hypothetical protein